MESSAQKSDPMPWHRILTKELLAGLGLGLLYPFSALPKAKVSHRRSREERTLVLIHGYLGNRTSFLPIKSYLQFHGIKNIVNFEYSSRQSAQKSAIELASFLKRHVRGGRIDFLCHSLGGIIARIYLQMLGGKRRCDRCITIGSPHHGTYNAYWVPTKIGRDLRPESEIFRRLAQRDTEDETVKYVSISGDTDNIVLPRTSAGLLESHRIKETGHLGLLWSPNTMRIVLNSLA